MEAQAEQTLSDNRSQLDDLAEQLLKHEALAKKEVEKILVDSRQAVN